jgi:hypothetical protein
MRPPSPALPANPTPALAAPTATSIPSPTMDIINSAKVTDTGVNDGVSPAIVRAEVMLDRVHASPGVIDGRDGENFVHALEIYEKAKGLRAAKGLGDKVWSSLLAESGGPVLMEYVLTEQDVEGPFFPNLPKDYGELAKLKTIGYRNPSQKIGAMFHMGEDLLAALNPGVDLSKAGTKILVAEVKPQPIPGTLKTIVVDKKKSHSATIAKATCSSPIPRRSAVASFPHHRAPTRSRASPIIRSIITIRTRISCRATTKRSSSFRQVPTTPSVRSSSP